MSTSRRSMTIVVLFALLAVLFGSSDAEAGKKKRKAKKLNYHFEVSQVKAAEGVEGTLAADAIKLLEAEANKQIAAHPQLKTDMSTAPDPSNTKAYKAWLKKKKLGGAYAVVVALTSYREELEDSPKEDGTKRFVVRLELHMFGETIPERKMGFEGVGSSTVKQDVGKKMRPADREYTIKNAIELAVTDALRESLDKLSAAATAKPKK